MDNFKSYLEESADAALKKKADKSGYSLSILKQVYKRGVAAWKNGHKPGTNPQQWGMARVNSFMTGGRTRVKGDPDLWAKQKGSIGKPKKVAEEVELDEGSRDIKQPGPHPDMVKAGIKHTHRQSPFKKSKTYVYVDKKDHAKAEKVLGNQTVANGGNVYLEIKEDVSERTLTPAEKKKREEIAKAMERDNPGMDMGKKMAIATATAKKVAEEKDPNEYDREGEMMKSQLRQISSANEKLMKMVGDDDNLPEWVQNKVTKATDYIRSVRDYLESENGKDDMSEAKVDEISLDMLTKKVSNTNLGNVRKAMKTDKVKTDLAMMKKKLDNHKGMKPIKAQTEAKVDEISTPTLMKYRDKARQNLNKSRNSAMASAVRGDKDSYHRDTATMKKREKGLKNADRAAVRNIRKEDVQSADKKPEKYVKPDGKVGIRMVRVDKQVIKKDA